MTPIKYIGHRPTYREGCYGSGIVFAKDGVINVEDDALANKLLRHPDVYVKADVAAEAAPVVVPKAPTNDQEDAAQDTRDSIMAMDKAALASYAKTHFSVEVDQRKSVGSLRTQVVGLFDQFGVE